MSFTFFENLLKVSNNARIIILFKSKLELELFTLTQLYRDNESKFLLYNIKNIKKLFLYIFRIKKAYSLGVDEDKSKKLFKLLFVKDFYIANPYNYGPSTAVWCSRILAITGRSGTLKHKFPPKVLYTAREALGTPAPLHKVG